MKPKTAKDFVRNEKRRKTFKTADAEPAKTYSEVVRKLGYDPLRRGTDD